jgi:hypothetical protein
MTGSVSIRGNIVLNGCDVPYMLRFLPPVPTTHRFGGVVRQLLYSPGNSGNCWFRFFSLYASPNVTWDLDNPAGIYLDPPWKTSSNFHFTHGNIICTNWQFMTDSTSTVTGASQSTGWIETLQTRRVTANGPVHFDVGDSANYLPVDVDVRGVTKPGYVMTGAQPGRTGSGTAQLDENHLVHRTWTVTASNDVGNLTVPNFFGDLDATFRFQPSDVDPGSDPLQFVVRQHTYPIAWHTPALGAQTTSSVQVLALTPAVVDTFWYSTYGLPVTPSLSVFDASQAEGNGPAAVVPAAQENPVQASFAAAPGSPVGRRGDASAADDERRSSAGRGRRAPRSRSDRRKSCVPRPLVPGRGRPGGRRLPHG